MVGWIIFLAVALPLLAIFVWMILTDSLVNIPAGRLGLLLVKGRATDTVLPPGPHWVPALRRRMVAEYPSLELSYRARDSGGEDPTTTIADLERTGPALRGMLGDRTAATLGYTVRFQLDTSQLRAVHERFGPDGVWSAVRDVSSRAVRRAVGRSDVGITDVFGDALNDLQRRVGEAVAEALDGDGLRMTTFAFDDVDLGRTGDVIQAIGRARWEQEREAAESQLRLTRARIDAELAPYLGEASDAALRYREVDVWRDIVNTPAERSVAVSSRPWTRAGSPSGEPAAEVEVTEPATGP